MCYLRDIKDFAEAHGWSVERANNRHLKFVHPERTTVFGSATPSDYRSALNIQAKLKRAERAQAGEP